MDKQKHPPYWVKAIVGTFHYGYDFYMHTDACPIPLQGVRGDIKRFVEYTKDCVLVMGRKTWDELPKRPLDGRINVIISNQRSQEILNESEMVDPTIVHYNNITDPEGLLKQLYNTYKKPICIIGGAQVLSLFAKSIDTLFLSYVSITKNDFPKVFDTGSEYTVLPKELTPYATKNGTLKNWNLNSDNVQVGMGSLQSIPKLKRNAPLYYTNLITPNGINKLLNHYGTPLYTPEN